MRLRRDDADWHTYWARMTNAGKAPEVKPGTLKNGAGKHRSVRKEKVKGESVFWLKCVSEHCI